MAALSLLHQRRCDSVETVGRLQVSSSRFLDLGSPGAEEQHALNSWWHLHALSMSIENF